MSVHGYARVTAADTDPGEQHHQLIAAGVPLARIVTDHASGARAPRPGLDHLLGAVAGGDQVVVCSLDRLARSVTHLAGVVAGLDARGVSLRSLAEGIDTTTLTGSFLADVAAGVLAIDHALTRERAVAARAAPVGRPTSVSQDQYRVVHQLAGQGRSQASIARSTGLSRATVGRVLRGEITQVAAYDRDVPDDQLPLYQGPG